MSGIKRAPNVAHRVSFLANRESIAKMLSDGYSFIQIWRDLSKQGILKIGYIQFNRYIHRYILEDKNMNKIETPKKKENKKLNNFDDPLKNKFEYSPHSNVEDLV